MEVFLVDDLHPEDIAMVQALYSRSSRSVLDHLSEVSTRGSGNFMSKFYVGYGHKSIGDCGATTLFFENVSMLAAKAIQDNPLYSGQETSTRYIDFANQGFVDPIGNKVSREHFDSMVEFYKLAFEDTVEFIRNNVNKQEETKQTVWEKAINARAFDVCRALLPVGMKTQLSWATNLRQASDHVSRLLLHPLEEVRKLARVAADQLQEKYPSSFDFDTSKSEAQRMYEAELASFAYSQTTVKYHDETLVDFSSIDKTMLSQYADVASKRPRGSELPKALDGMGIIRCQFFLDYGSFRDLQRHRGVHMEMPLISSTAGFESWYLENLSPKYQELAKEHLATVYRNVQSLTKNNELSVSEAQYFLPMGTQVECKISGTLPKLIYLLELRSGLTVHPTLRRRAWDIANAISEHFPEIPLHVDRRADQFNSKRGEQDILRPQRSVTIFSVMNLVILVCYGGLGGRSFRQERIIKFIA